MPVTDWRGPTSLVAESFTGNQAIVPPLQTSLQVIDNAFNSGGVITLSVSPNTISRPLRCRGYGFSSSDIPAGAVITGVELDFHRNGPSSQTRSGGEFYIGLVKDGTGAAARVGDNKARPANWTQTSATSGYESFLYGGEGDAWNAGLTRDDVLNAGFGVDFQAQSRGSITFNARLDAMRLRIYYGDPLPPDPPTGESPFLGAEFYG